MTVKELIRRLKKVNPDAYVAIQVGQDVDWNVSKLSADFGPVRLNTMSGWGEDRNFKGYVCIVAGTSEMVVMEQREPPLEAEHV